MSFDPVAIQSVGLDILYAQSLNNTEPGYYDVPRIMLRDMADDILREMATPSSTPSGTIYRQQGQPIPSLGVFEHWDSPMTMRYSRNLDPKNGKGIEFIYIPMGSAKEQAASAPYQGLDHLDFFYAGESTKHRMYIVRDGQIAWSYFDPDGRGEISDAVLLSDGHILMAHQHGIREVIPTPGSADGYTVAWQMDTPKGYEIHSIQPIGKDKIVYVQCGDPLTCVVREVPSMKLIREFKLPYRDGGSHGQMRNFRLTRKGTLLLASMQYGAIIEFDSHGQELRRIDMPGAWGVEELKNGNILACSNRGFAREYNKKGKVVWEYDWSKNPAYKDISTQKAHRLPNGNTLMNNWFNEWSSQRIDSEHPDVQAIEVTPDGRIVWELSSWFPPADLGPSTTIQPLNEPVNRNKMRFGDIKP